MAASLRFVTGSLLLLMAAVPVLASDTVSSAELSLPTIHVVDQAGKALPHSEAAIVKMDNQRSSFGFVQADDSGDIHFNQRKSPHQSIDKIPEGKYDVLVLARGKAPFLTTWELPTSAPLTARVSDGEQVKITLKTADGKPIPSNVVPTFYPQDFGDAVWEDSGDAEHSLWPERLGDGQFQIALEETTAPWRLCINGLDFLRGYETDFSTSEALEKHSAEYVLPEAGMVAVELSVPDNLRSVAASKTFSYKLYKAINLKGDNRTHIVLDTVTSVTVVGGLKKTMSHIAPGEYWAMISEELNNGGSPGNLPFNKSAEVVVESGETTSVTEEFRQFDPAILMGDAKARITVTRLDGSPAANLSVRLKYWPREFGGAQYTVTSGTLSDKGTTTIAGLASKVGGGPMFSLVKGDSDYGDTIGRFQLDSSDTSHTFNFQLAPAEGDQAPDITLHDLQTSDTVKLSDLRGKLVLLDFWATWCGPCQAPMAHNQKMLEENGDRWGDRVIIVGASIDDLAKTALDHVRQKGWEKVRQMWCGPGGFKGVPPTTYHVDGIPTALLIDPAGKIIWRGHPAALDLESKIDQLLEAE